MNEVLKDADGSPLAGVLKGLQGTTMTKKKLFDFLADINLEELYGKKENIIYGEHAAHPVEPTKPVIPVDFTLELLPISDDKPETEAKEIQCQACMKTFTVNGSLKRHLERSKACKDWIELPQKTDIVPLTKGIHLVIDEVLDRAISGEELQCKFCQATFISKGNLHKHFNYATVCNRLAYKEFKKLFLEL